MNKLSTVDFHGDKLPVLKKDGVKYVVMKPITKALGLNWSAQLKRIKRDDVLSTSMSVMDTEVCRNGQAGEIIALPIEMMHGWLMGVNSRRVKPEVKEKLFQYKKECYKVLDAYFNKGVAVNHKLIKELKTAIEDRDGELASFESANFEQLKKIEDLQGDLEDMNRKLNRLQQPRYDRAMLENLVIQCTEGRYTIAEIWQTVLRRLKLKCYVNIGGMIKETGSYALAIEQSNLLKPAFEIVYELMPRKQISYIGG